MQNGFNPPDVALLNFEQLSNLPGPRLGWACDDVTAVGRFEVPGLPAGVIEEAEAEHDAAFTVNGDKTAVPYPGDEMSKAGLELLFAAPCA